MDKVTKDQVAVELTEAEKDELKKLLDIDSNKRTFVPKPTVTPGACEHCSDLIDYCCKVDIPEGFNANIKNEKLAVVTELFCFVDPCPCEVACQTINLGTCTETLKLTLYPVRVIGGIEFIASASSVEGEAGLNGAKATFTLLNPATKSADISCQGSLLVNQVVNFKKFAPTQAQSTPKKIPTEEIKATFSATVEDCACGDVKPGTTTKVVKFEGQFKLPIECPDPTPCPTAAP